MLFKNYREMKHLKYNNLLYKTMWLKKSYEFSESIPNVIDVVKALQGATPDEMANIINSLTEMVNTSKNINDEESEDINSGNIEETDSE